MKPKLLSWSVMAVIAIGGVFALVACSSDTETVVQTVIVEKQVPGETIIETVIVTEKGDTIIQTVVVEKIVIQTAVPGQPATPTPFPAAQPAPQSKQAAGEIIWAIRGVGGAGGGYNARAISPGPSLGVVETLFKTTSADAAAPQLATSWTMTSNGLSVTVDLRRGVQFHQGYGEMKAVDVAWSYNDANPATSVEFGSGDPSITDSGGSWGALLGSNPLEVIDDYTVKITFTAFNPLWNIWFFGSDGLSAGVVSKKAFDENGKEWNVNHMVATGPFELLSNVRGDRMILGGIADHWRKVPDVKKITLLSIPDETVRQAVMLSGEADVAEMSLGVIPSLRRAGFTALTNGNELIHTIWFTGNLWEAQHPTSGEPLTIGTTVHDLPWIGDPFKPDDGNNPPGIDDMEQARLVRTALSMAIERELLNDKVVGGLGTVQYLPFFDVNAPEWNSKWEIPYDPAKANQLLDQAGFPKNSDGERFSIPLFGFEYARPVPAGIADGVAGMWEDIGVSVDVFHYNYAVFRPSIVGRTAVIPWVEFDGTGSRTNHPWDWPRGEQASALSRGGKSHAVEAPEATANYQAVSKETDRDKRIALNNDFADFLFHEQIGIATIAAGKFLVVNPNKIASWDMEPGIRQPFNTPENIVLK